MIVVMVQSKIEHRTLKTAKWKKQSLGRALRRLVLELAEVDQQRESGSFMDVSGTNISDPDEVDRRAAIEALVAVQSFLVSQSIHSDTLYFLRKDLRELELGELPATFKPKKHPGRKSDDLGVMCLKARLAGLAYAYMHSGMSRDIAARQVANNIPRPLAKQISGKPLGVGKRTVEAWMDRYGGNLQVRGKLKGVRFDEDFWDLLHDNLPGDEVRLGTGYCLYILWLSYLGAPRQSLLELAITGGEQFFNFAHYAKGSVLFHGPRDEGFGFLSRNYMGPSLSVSANEPVAATPRRQQQGGIRAP